MPKVTVATVNAALKKAGYAERIVQGKDGSGFPYVYFTEGNAHTWYSSTVAGTPRVTSVQDVNWWIQQRNRLAEEKF